MQTHDDFSHEDAMKKIEEMVFGVSGGEGYKPRSIKDELRDEKMVELKNLEKRASEMKAAGLSQITSGRDGEEAIESYDFKSVHVKKLPDDPDGVLRISIGGGKTIEGPINYCVYRGNKDRCISALKRALLAMERGGN